MYLDDATSVQKHGVTSARREYKGEYAMILTCIAHMCSTCGLSWTNHVFTTSRHNDGIFNPSSSLSYDLPLRVIFRSSWESRARVQPYADTHLLRVKRRDPKRSRGSAGRMETPACVHKHVREPLCKFLNTTGPYIHTATRVGVRKIKLVFATNVSRLKRPLGSNKRRRTSRANNCHERSARPCVRLSFEPEC